MESYRKFLVFSPDYHSKIAFVSTESVQDSFLIDVDWNVAVNSAKPKLFMQNDESADNDDEDKGQNGNSEDLEKKSLHNIAVTEANGLLAFTASDKSLFVWKINGQSTKVLSRRSFIRTSSCIRFSKCGTLLFLADKTGDVFEYPCDEENINSRGRWIFGHMSQILDLKASADLSCIVTSDRDEKIRVTSYPKVHEIKMFCLGHKEFVSAISVISDSCLLSISGDKSMKLWDFNEGKELQSHSFSFVPLLLKVIVQSPQSGLICVSSTTHSVHVFKFTINSSRTLTLLELGEKQFRSDIELAILGSDFYIEYNQKEDDEAPAGIFIDRIKVEEDSASFQGIFDNKALSCAADMNAKIFKTYDVPLLFKNSRMFDNVKQYIDRKKARIESKAAGKK